MRNIGAGVFLLSWIYFMSQLKMDFLPAFTVALVLGVIANLLLNRR